MNLYLRKILLVRHENRFCVTLDTPQGIVRDTSNVVSGFGPTIEDAVKNFQDEWYYTYGTKPPSCEEILREAENE